MPRPFRYLFGLVLLTLLGACASHRAPSAETLRVMSFNIRYASPEDGINVWEDRQTLTAKVILDRRPALVGTQELLLSQAHDLAKQLPGYTWFGRGRNGDEIDANGNEHMGVFYDTARLRLIDSGDFWLSETPEVPGSDNFGQSMPRMVTWAHFEDRHSGRRFHYFNTHFPHKDEAEAIRERCAALIIQRMQQLPQDEPFILTGDFNTVPGRAAHANLTATLRDTWQEAPVRVGPEFTFHDFGRQVPDKRIDWILYRGLDVRRVETVTDHQGMRYPSDHFPVVADFAL